MSTPTAIEAVRQFLEHIKSKSGKPHEIQFCQDLASVLRDAERFKALELAHNNAESNLGWARFNPCTARWGVEGLWPLAELADKLMEGT